MTAPAKAAPMRDDVTREKQISRIARGHSVNCAYWDEESPCNCDLSEFEGLAHTARPDAGDEDVERVAKILKAAELDHDRCHEPWQFYEPTARAALAAMREGVDRGMVERRDRYLAGLFDAIFESFCEGDSEIEVNDLITDGALAAGLVECVAFDPDEHIDVSSACETGDNFYQITAAGRQVLTLARQKAAALSLEQPR